MSQLKMDHVPSSPCMYYSGADPGGLWGLETPHDVAINWYKNTLKCIIS